MGQDAGLGVMDRAALTVIDGDARIACRRLQEVLGFTRIDSLHKLIRAHLDELEDFGGIFRFEAEKSGRGRRSVNYYLNEHQATAVCLWAETPKARAARRLIIEVFTAWRKGQMPAPPVPAADPFAANAARVAHVADHFDRLPGLDEKVLLITHLPIWKNGRRPPWWHDVELRTFLTAIHRQMSTIEAERQGRARFGARCPTGSTIHRYWQRLDKAFGPVPLPRHIPRPKKEAA